MNTPKARQAAFNASSSGQWEGFSGHRQAVTSLLGLGGGRLCVLGAGNANDLDLPALLTAYREVHLVDLDAEALTRGAERQGVLDRPSLYLHGGVDLSALLDVIGTWTPLTSIVPADLDALAAWPAGRVAGVLPGPFERVASTCLLSPLIGNAFHALGESHTAFPLVVRAIRIGHLRLLTQLVAPGGEAVLITDVASTDVVPDRAGQTVERRFFHGVDPAVILATYRDDPYLASRVTKLERLNPWRWNLHRRGYLVWAVRYEVVERPPR